MVFEENGESVLISALIRQLVQIPSKGLGTGGVRVRCHLHRDDFLDSLTDYIRKLVSYELAQPPTGNLSSLSGGLREKKSQAIVVKKCHVITSPDPAPDHLYNLLHDLREPLFHVVPSESKIKQRKRNEYAVPLCPTELNTSSVYEGTRCNAVNRCKPCSHLQTLFSQISFSSRQE